MTRQVMTAIVVTMVTALGGCAQGANLDSSSSAVAVTKSLPPPDPAGAAVDFSNYRIGPLDVIAVDVFGAPELAREGAVDSAGNFSMPLVGTVKAGGSTPSETAAKISELLKGRYLKHPQVSVNVKEARAQSVTIDGAVRNPGVYPIIGRLTLQQAVATARGVDELSDLNKVVVFRTVNNQKMAALFNLKDIRAGRAVDPQVYGNDIVVVGESSARRFIKDLTSSFPVFGSFLPMLRGSTAPGVTR